MGREIKDPLIKTDNNCTISSYLCILFQFRDSFMRREIIIFSLLASLFWACSSGTEPAQSESKPMLKVGIWRGVLKPQGIEMPFLFRVGESGAAYSLEIMNAEERTSHVYISSETR